MRRKNFTYTNIGPGNSVGIDERLATPGLTESLLGGLAYLKDTQVKHENNYSVKAHNFYGPVQSKKFFNFQIISRLRNFTGNMLVREKHLEGSWPGFIKFLPFNGFRSLQPIFTATDYNLYTTVSTANSLLFFDDRTLPSDQRFVSNMLESASIAIKGFRRGSAYNFWKTRTNSAKPYPFSAPLNIPPSIIDFRASIYDLTGFLGLKPFYESDVLMDWLIRIYNKAENSTGSTALFNIPDDSDNTSMAVGFQILYDRWKNNSGSDLDLSPLKLFPLFRDLNRNITDRHNKYIGHKTGAFLTWLKDEDTCVFSNPESGIIPLSVNNVDIVVNANILFALSLAGKQTLPGFKDAVKLIIRVIKEGIWLKASLYYPENMVFPYALSRAVRDGGLEESEIKEVLPILLSYLLEEQKAFETVNPSLSGAFPAMNEHSYTMATALGLITLLNIGRSAAEASGMEIIYDNAVEKAVKFLIASRRSDRIQQYNTEIVLPGIVPNYWESGILYSSSLQQLAYWYSHAQTTSLVLEALAKYILGYDKEYNFKQFPYIYLSKTGTSISLSLDKPLF